MNGPYKYLQVDQRDGVFCVRLRFRRLEDHELYDLANELVSLATEQGCRKLALSLGPRPPEYLYSVFLAKLMTVIRQHHQQGGEMVLCEVSPQVRSVFEACGLDRQFTFLPTFEDAIAHWQQQDNPQ